MYTEVKNIIPELRNDCSNGFDNILVKFLKPVVEEIASPIVHIINSSIDKEIFPDSWKVARVCPVPKIVSPVKEKDFRPISILPVLCELYEKIFYINLMYCKVISIQLDTIRDSQRSLNPVLTPEI